MPLVNMLSHAYKHQYAIAAFDVVSLDFIDDIIAAAEAKQAPTKQTVSQLKRGQIYLKLKRSVPFNSSI